MILVKVYYCEVEKFSNIYGMQLGLGGAYGHKFVNISLDELVWYASIRLMYLSYGSMPPHT